MEDKHKVFNHAVKSLIKELITTFPSKKEYKLFLLIYKMTKAISKKTPQKYFKECVLSKYRNELINEDDSFFSHEIFQNDDFPISIQVFLKELTNINDMWSSIDGNNKKVIWQHIKVIISASDRCDDDTIS